MTTQPVVPAVQQLRTAQYMSLRESLGEAISAELESCACRLREMLLARGTVAGSVVLAMFGGGKDSTFMTAAARYIHLYFEHRYGETFVLRVASNRHSGMTTAVTKNIDRVYRGLGMYDDPGVELLMVNGTSISAFDPTERHVRSLRIRDRLDVLMSGHRCQGDARPTFCNRCNLSMENSVALAIGFGAPADVVLTGDSPLEQRRYLAWVRTVTRKMGNAPAQGNPGLRTFLLDLEQINRHLATNIYGPGACEVDAHHIAVEAVRTEPLFFSVYEDTSYSAGDHWQLLLALGFEFDEIAFAFSESDCGNPALMAHLHGLRNERLLKNSYADGIREYVRFAVQLMRRKEFPEHLVSWILRRYKTSEDIGRMRALMDRYALENFDLSEAQLVCMVFSPFVEEGKFLFDYLTSEHPGQLSWESQIRDVLAGKHEEADIGKIVNFLQRISGLDLPHLRRLFQSSLVRTRDVNGSGSDLISIILRNDPHKAIVEHLGQHGQMVREIITGR